MFGVFLRAHTEGRPAGIGHPTMLFGQLFFKERVVNRARERNIDNSTEMNMAHFGLIKEELPSSEPVQMHGYMRPR